MPKRTLIVVDMQRDFIDGSLGTKEAQAIVPNVKRKIEEYKARGDEVIFTMDTHYDNYLLTLEGKKLPFKHCIKDTPGWEIHPDLDTNMCTKIHKNTFGYTSWKSYGAILAGGEIELVGVCSGICVLSNAIILKATFPGTEITVDASCCACVNPESHKNALEAMKMYQINIINE